MRFCLCSNVTVMRNSSVLFTKLLFIRLFQLQPYDHLCRNNRVIAMEAPSTGKRSRKSRFEDDEPEPKRVQIDLDAARARAEELSRSLQAKIASVSMLLNRDGGARPLEKKPEYRPLRLNAQGQEIDEHGNVIKAQVFAIKTVAANQTAAKVMQKKENPYLLHRNHEPETTEIIDERLATKKRDNKLRKALHFIEPGRFIEENEKLKEKEDRKIIAGYTSGRKSLSSTAQPFNSETTSTENSSNYPQISSENSSNLLQTISPSSVVTIAPWSELTFPSMEWWDEAFLPKLTQKNRKISRVFAEKDDFEELSIGNVKTVKYICHPVPIRPLGMAGTQQSATTTIPLFLTKQERKKLRRANRLSLQQTRRDQQMLGILPKEEVKFKLSNFMKILGDQAVADPSKVELKVVQQMQARLIAHRMRNLQLKLTPKQKSENKLRKLHEDVGHGVFVAVFRCTDFSCTKYRFKVDVFAQQWLLSGLALLNLETQIVTQNLGLSDTQNLGMSSPIQQNLIVVEGGAKSIKKFVKLLTKRIDWTKWIPSNVSHHITTAEAFSGEEGENAFVVEGEEVGDAMEVVEEEAFNNEAADVEGDGDNQENDHGNNNEEADDDSSSSSSDSEQETDTHHAAHPSSSSLPSSTEIEHHPFARCDLLWTGMLPKRQFTGFKFVEAKNSGSARKVLESKGLAHYWDMVTQADEILKGSSNGGETTADTDWLM